MSPKIRIVPSAEQKQMDKKEKLSLIVFSGDFDKAIAAFTLATGAAATNREVNMFFTFWGLNIIRKNKGRLPLSRFNFFGITPRLLTFMMRKKNVATLDELIEAAKALNINFIACEMAMNILEMKKEDLIDEVKEVVGVPTFLELAKDGMTLFI
jgi:peroxiredoxin family protein